ERPPRTPGSAQRALAGGARRVICKSPGSALKSGARRVTTPAKSPFRKLNLGTAPSPGRHLAQRAAERQVGPLP
ncbi:hypothetical protein T484DRAFT_1814822, partial [Baffinella frigidus]